MLESGQYPSHDGRPVVGCLEWIQYQLDNSQTIADVMKNAHVVRISANTKLHYLVCDKSGACVTAEFINGKFAPHYGSSLPVAALTNDTYDNSIAYAKTLTPFGGSAAPTNGPGSLERFGRAAAAVKNFSTTPQDAVSYSFGVLDNVAQGTFTKWNVVYDIANLRVYFRTTSNRQIKQLSLRGLDFGCDTPVRVFNMNSNAQGDISSRLINYTTQLNRNLVRRSYHSTPIFSGVTDEQLEPSVIHPDSFTCQSR
jgi:penicillin V acylase-like amidase (Ntn superfamily)